MVGFLFGGMLDINMAITSHFSDYTTLASQIIAQFAGCTILGLAVAAEIRCGSVTMPGEGIQIAISRVSGWAFPKVKMLVDTILALTAALCGICLFGSWPWTVVGPGTLFAMFYVGYVVKLVNPTWDGSTVFSLIAPASAATSTVWPASSGTDKFPKF